MQNSPCKPVESNEVTPEKQSRNDTNEDVKTNSDALKELKETEYAFKTNEESSHSNELIESEVNRNVTPKKSTSPKETKSSVKETSESLKESKNRQIEFKTPEKTSQPSQSLPGKSSFDLKLEQSCDGEDGMISTTEQARLLIAASKTPSKSVNRTPVKQNTPSGKRSIENSPVTPGKHRRVELITLASPKAKRLKQI